MQFLEQRESGPVAAVLGEARSLVLNSVAQEGQKREERGLTSRA